MLLMFSLLVIEMLIGICYSFPFQICKMFFSMFVCGIHPPSLCHYRIFAMFDIFCSGLLLSTFHWFTSSGPLYSKTYSLHNPKHVIPSTCTRQEYSSSLLHQRLFAPATTSHTQPVSSHSQKSPKVESLLFSKNWQLYFSLVYLFWAPLQQNSGHYTPYITCFFPQPEKPKSRAPFFLEKLATLLFTGLPLLGPSTAKLRPLHPIHNLFLPTARKAQK